MNKLFSFNLFCQRKKFSMEKYFSAFPTSDYKEFSNFLISRNVQPPSEVFFLKHQPVTNHQNVIEEKVPEVVKVVEEVVEEPAPPKKTRRRRTRKTKKNE